MPGPALTVSILGDTTQLQTALSQGAGGIQGFTERAVGLVDGIMGIKNIVGDATEILNGFVALGGPEAQAAMEDLTGTLGEALAPALEKLAPLIVKLIEGLGQLLEAVLPVLIPLIDGLVTVLGSLFDAIGTVVDILNDLWSNVLQPLIDNVLNALWDKLDAVRGMFDLVGQVINAVTGFFQPLLDAVNAILGPIGSLLGTVGDLIGDLGEALGLSTDLTDESKKWAAVESGGSFGTPVNQGAMITINTGADPGAVTRAIRRYAASNGGGRAFTRNVVGVRGH